MFNSKQYKMSSTQIAVKMVLARWYALVKDIDNVIDSITDEQLSKEIAPNKNRGIYLLGHLIAVNDDILLLLDMGEKLFPALNVPFLKLPDKAINEIPLAQDLRTYWKKSNDVLAQKFDSLEPDDWFTKHSVVSAEDFTKEPHRNKLNIIITRTTHLAHHLGQLVLLKQGKSD